MMTMNADQISGVIAGLLTPLIMAAAILIDGWALWMLWGWFALPLGLPQIGIAHAIGIGILVGVATIQYVPNPKGSATPMSYVNYLFVRPVLAVLVGWIVSLAT